MPPEEPKAKGPASFMWIDRQPEIISILARIETKIDKMASKILDLEGQVLEYIERAEELRSNGNAHRGNGTQSSGQ